MLLVSMVTAEAYEILFHSNNDISLRGNSVCLDVQVKGDKIDGACSAHVGCEKCLQWSWLYVNVPEPKEFMALHTIVSVYGLTLHQWIRI